MEKHKIIINRKLGVLGRLVIPSDIRKELGFKKRQELILETEGNKLVISMRQSKTKK